MKSEVQEKGFISDLFKSDGQDVPSPKFKKAVSEPIDTKLV